VTSIANALLVRDCDFNRLFVRLGNGYLSCCQDLFDGRDDPVTTLRIKSGCLNIKDDITMTY